MICVRLKGCAYGVKKKNPFKIRLNSDDCFRCDNFFRNILMFYTEKCVPLYATRVGMT